MTHPTIGIALLAANVLALEVERLLTDGGGNEKLREALAAFDAARIRLRGDSDPQKMTVANWPANDEPAPPTLRGEP